MNLKSRSVSLVGLLTAFSGLATAVTFQFPAGLPGISMPNYYSGTNCRVSGSAMGGLFTDAYLFVVGNGEETLVAEFHADSESLPLSVSLAAMIDSSHFAPGTSVATKLVVHDLFNANPVIGQSSGVPVRNKVSLFEHPDPVISPDAVAATWLLFQNYDLSGANGGSWNEASYFADLLGSNVAFYAGHSGYYHHWAGNNEDFHHCEEITPADYLTTRTAQMGTGYPPYNTGTIPINFLYILGCNAGFNSNFLSACFPGFWSYSNAPPLEDQAFIGYKVFVYLQEYWLHVFLIWKTLTDGHTVETARVKFNEYFVTNPGALTCEDNGTDRNMMLGDLWLYCGPDLGAARIKTANTGTNSDPIGWHYQL